jgi:hypothetical protein
MKIDHGDGIILAFAAALGVVVPLDATAAWIGAYSSSALLHLRSLVLIRPCGRCGQSFLNCGVKSGREALLMNGNG